MRLLLGGGGSGEKTKLTNKVFNDIIDHDKPLLYIPLAMDDIDNKYDSCYTWITGEMGSVNLKAIEMVRSFEELINKDFNSYCAIFIGGGNTFKLLKGLKDYNIYKKLEEFVLNDGIVYGGSAGAVIFGKDINSILSTDDNEVNLIDTKGYNLINGKSLFCHYTNRSSKLTEEENNLKHKYITDTLINYTKNNEEVIALPEEDTIYINKDKIEVIGTKNYYIFKNGEITEIELL